MRPLPSMVVQARRERYSAHSAPMTIHPSAIWQRLLSSFWFIPSLVTLGAIACALLFIELDEFIS